MSLAVNALTRALFQRLSSTLPAPVYGSVPQGSSSPYIVIGEKTATPARDKDSDGQEITVTLHIWSNAAGDKECADLLQAAYAATDRQEASIPLDGFALVELVGEFLQLLPDYGDDAEPDRYTHGVLRLRATVEG